MRRALVLSWILLSVTACASRGTAGGTSSDDHAIAKSTATQACHAWQKEYSEPADSAGDSGNPAAVLAKKAAQGDPAYERLVSDITSEQELEYSLTAQGSDLGVTGIVNMGRDLL